MWKRQRWTACHFVVSSVIPDRLISIMGFPILVRRHVYIETGPKSSHPNYFLCRYVCTTIGHVYDHLCFTSGSAFMYTTINNNAVVRNIHNLIPWAKYQTVYLWNIMIIDISFHGRRVWKHPRCRNIVRIQHDIFHGYLVSMFHLHAYDMIGCVWLTWSYSDAHSDTRIW